MPVGARDENVMARALPPKYEASPPAVEKRTTVPRRRRSFPISRFLILGACGLLIVAVRAYSGVKLLSPAVVEVCQPRADLLVTEVFGTGTLESKVVISVSAKFVGKVAEVLADQGDRVRAGQPLAWLEAKDYEDAMHAAEVRLDQAEAEFAKANLDLQRSQT